MTWLLRASGAIARRRRATLLVYLYIYNSVRLFVCLFVCSFAIRAKTTAQNATKRSGIIKWGSTSVLHGTKSPILQFLKRYPSISSFSFAADGHFINYRSLDFRLSDGLIHCCLTIDFKLGRRYSSYLLLLPAHIHQNWLGPTRCCATRHSRSPPKAGALLVYNKMILLSKTSIYRDTFQLYCTYMCTSTY